MKWDQRGLKRFLLILGDIAVFYGALALTLWVRYGANWQAAIPLHLKPFTVLLALGLFIFYSMRLYDISHGQGPTLWLQSAIASVLMLLVAAVFFFYFFSRGAAMITPRGTLFIFFLIFGGLFVIWRKFARELLQKRLREKALVVGRGKAPAQLAAWLKSHPEVGYDVLEVREELAGTGSLMALAKSGRITAIIAAPEGMKKFAPQFMQLADLGLNFWDLLDFYEVRLEKIPLEYVSDEWVLQNINRRESPATILMKSLFDRLVAALVLVISLPLWPIIALAVKIDSRGPIFYRQTRVGRDGVPFRLIKFRTMKADAEADGPKWAEAADPRITRVGRILRQAHLDELPQLLNILKGEMSFVGPRPERPEFVRELEAKIPYYSLRHLVKPGFTGWAQINYPYGNSVEDAEQKLEYDLYYLKHRSLLLDFSIFLKTIRLFFYNPQK